MASNFSDSCEMITCCKWGRIDWSISEEGQGLGYGELMDLGVISLISGCSGKKKVKKIIFSDWSIAAVWGPLYLYEIPVPAFF